MNIVNSKRVEELDALRGIAASSVVFFHYTLHRNEYNAIFKFGTTGVDLFFMISGFVIFMSVNRVSSSIDFVINRVSRLYPTYWVCVTFSFMLIFFKNLSVGTSINRYDIENYIGNLSMFQFYLNMPDFEGSYWTMVVEMLFYISILFLHKLRLLQHINTIGFVSCLVIAVLAHFFYDITFVKKIFTLLPLIQFIPLFFAGILFYKIYTEKKDYILKYFYVLICFISQLFLFPVAGRSRDFISYNEYIFMLFLFFVLFVAFVNHWLKFIVNSSTLFLGKISFALYLIHGSISDLIITTLTEKLNFNFWVASVCCAFPIVVSISAFITIYIEGPQSKKMKAKLRSINKSYCSDL